MSLWSITERASGADPSTLKWIGGTIAALILWGVVYSHLVPFAEWVGALLPVEPTSHLGEAIRFFVYDTPKVLMLLTLVVFGWASCAASFHPRRRARSLPGNERASATCWPMR